LSPKWCDGATSVSYCVTGMALLKAMRTDKMAMDFIVGDDESWS